MIRNFTFILILVSSSFTWACMVPHSGAEYDELITLKRSTEESTYHIEFPKNLEGTGSAVAYLSYSKSGVGDIRLAEFTIPLKFWFGWNVLSGNFKVPVKKGYIPYVRVIWPGEVCNTVANIDLVGFK